MTEAAAVAGFDPDWSALLRRIHTMTGCGSPTRGDRSRGTLPPLAVQRAERDAATAARPFGPPLSSACHVPSDCCPWCAKRHAAPPRLHPTGVRSRSVGDVSVTYPTRCMVCGGEGLHVHADWETDG